MNVKIVAPNGTPTGSFFVDFDYQIKPAALRSLKAGEASVNSVFVTSKSVWSFVEKTDGTWEAELNESLTNQLKERGKISLSSMTEQPNPYSQPEEGKGVPIGEAKTPTSKRGIWFLLFMVFVVPLALFGLFVIGFVIWLVIEQPTIGV